MSAVAPMPRLQQHGSSRPAPAARVHEELAAIHDLPGISLAEINDRAHLQTRVDRKYVVPARLADGVLDAAAAAGAHALDIEGERLSPYASRYFDTPDLESFYRSATHRRRRFKVRLRTYLASDLSFCELKVAGLRGHTVKSRIPSPASAERAAALTPDETAFVAARLADVFADDALAASIARELRPQIDTLYARATLVIPGGDSGGEDASRITIDDRLTFRRPGAPEPVARSGDLVIETKSAGSPTAIDELLWRRGHRPVRMSKFATGMALAYPDLPRNRWQRTLRASDLRPLDPATPQAVRGWLDLRGSERSGSTPESATGPSGLTS